MIIILSFQSHQIRMLSVGLEWHGIDTDCPAFHLSLQYANFGQFKAKQVLLVPQLQTKTA